MYTATITGHSIQRKNKRVVIDMSITDGQDTFEEKMEFALNFTKQEMKEKIKRYLSELESVQTNIDDIAPTGVVDLSDVSDSTQTQADPEKKEWFRDFARMEQVQRLIDLGVLTGNEKPVENLRASLKLNFKPAYIADM